MDKWMGGWTDSGQIGGWIWIHGWMDGFGNNMSKKGTVRDTDCNITQKLEKPNITYINIIGKLNQDESSFTAHSKD